MALKGFVSYSDKDKILAGDLKNKLENRLGIDVFLAHEDIEPTSEWEETLKAELRACDVFIPIISKHFCSSAWTDQEVGFAVAREITIIPVKYDWPPYGFIGRYQALKISDDLNLMALKIADIIVKKPAIKDLFLDTSIEHFGKSFTFEIAGNNAELLLRFSNFFASRQINEIIRLADASSQIYKSSRGNQAIAKLIKLHKEIIDTRLLNSYKEKVII